ncbi:Protein MSS2, mitochondrial [[Candida] zeylanoides]
MRTVRYLMCSARAAGAGAGAGAVARGATHAAAARETAAASRGAATSAAPARPPLASLLPSKRTINRLLFDFDSRLTYRKVVPLLETIYRHLDDPHQIRLPRHVRGFDLMVQKHILATVRQRTQTTHRALVALENELVEQAAELGDRDAIAMLAFETLAAGKDHEDFRDAQRLVAQLVEQRHPLAFKLAGDLAHRRQQHAEAAQYWQQFLELESDTVLSSQVCSSLGVYYFTRAAPDLARARLYFERSLAVGELDRYTVVAHFYLGQMYVASHPELARFHLETAASQGFRESFAALGFMELNTFASPQKALEWLRLGEELNGDLQCVVGQFDCHVAQRHWAQAREVVAKVEAVRQHIRGAQRRGVRPQQPEMRALFDQNDAVSRVFFESRAAEIARANQG